ncbi:MAG: hypothetical protein K2L35_02935, partial [Muribaculaceae bacterium]|nr:hypothetical protein [Muribaculaceae bacterium]
MDYSLEAGLHRLRQPTKNTGDNSRCKVNAKLTYHQNNISDSRPDNLLTVTCATLLQPCVTRNFTSVQQFPKEYQSALNIIRADSIHEDAL